jgi:hypothetical protein
MATSCRVDMVTAFDASGQVCLQMVTDDAPQEVIARPRVAVARQDLEDGEPPFLCVSFGTPEKRFIFSIEFNDAAKLGAILMSHAVAEQLRQDREGANVVEAMFDEDEDDGEF